MTTHRQIMINIATAVRDSAEVLDYCKEAFGKGLDIHVGAYPAAIPDTKDAPFLWIFAEPVDNDDIKADEIFTVHGVLGCCLLGENGEKKICEVVTERTDLQNGLTINGGNLVIEELRDLCLSVIRNAPGGAIVNAIRRTENDLSHFPLEWAEFEVDYLEPAAL